MIQDPLEDPIRGTDSQPAAEAWVAVQSQFEAARHLNISELFTQNPRRAKELSLEAAGLLVDFSKNLIDSASLDSLLHLAEVLNVKGCIEQLFAGDALNHTEGRAALHVALRRGSDADLPQYGEIEPTLERMSSFVAEVHHGVRTGYSGKAFTDVVNIGIGGSDLGPAMVTEALEPYCLKKVTAHFVSNIDPSHLVSTLAGLNPETTLFIIASKSFTTLETLSNARSARQWLARAAGADDQRLNGHFVAVSAKVEKAMAFGIEAEAIYPMWDWVGGRYSLWSAIGLPIALSVGMEQFNRLLKGAADMDRHFYSAPLRDNIPVILALLEVWYVNCWGFKTQVVLPYDQYLEKLPAFLQQLTMESNGKSVNRRGSPLDKDSCPVVWGAAGTNGQHSFHQLLHQGTQVVPADFLVPLGSHNPLGEQHTHLFANCLAQTQALMLGKSLDEARSELSGAGLSEDEVERLAPHKVLPGNRPSTTICFDKTTPQTLGAIIAMYEHKVFVSSVVWNINAFDQWGVELGKQVSSAIYREMSAKERHLEFDASTERLLKRFQQFHSK